MTCIRQFFFTYQQHAFLLGPFLNSSHRSRLTDLHILTLWVWIPLRWDVIDKTLCDKVYQWLVAGQWFSLGTPVSSTNKTDCHDITEIFLKVALNTIIPPLPLHKFMVLLCLTNNINYVCILMIYRPVVKIKQAKCCKKLHTLLNQSTKMHWN